MFDVYERVKSRIIGRKAEIKSIMVAMRAGKHILLEGPSGTSKSTLLKTIAAQSHIPFYSMEGNIGLTPAQLVGHFNPARIMQDTYRPRYFEKGPVTLAMEKGGILYLDEFNRMPADAANILITPMEEGEIQIPRYGTVKAADSFTVIAARNTLDDVGTVRISRAFMDRVCVIKTGYQSGEEEFQIVRMKTGWKNDVAALFAVRMVRQTRNHPEIKRGASIRAAIDMVDLFTGMQKVSDRPAGNFLSAAHMALAPRISLNEMTNKTAEAVINEIWSGLKAAFELSSVNRASLPVGLLDPENEEKRQDETREFAEPTAFSSIHHDRTRNLEDVPLLDPESNDPHDYWRLAHYFNRHPEELESFFQQPGSLKAFSRMAPRLSDEAARLAVKMASRLIMKIARRIADTGYRSGKLKLVKGAPDDAEIELDKSLENHADAPERGILDNLVSSVRKREKSAFVMILDYSYSMQSNIVLAAITAAAIAQHFKKDYAVLAFSTDVTVLRETNETSGPEKVLERLFALLPSGETDIRKALEAGLRYVSRFERKSALILTDGDWNKGGDPFRAVVRFDKLSVIGFPPADYWKIRELALQGNGSFSFVKDESEIARAIIHCLN